MDDTIAAETQLSPGLHHATSGDIEFTPDAGAELSVRASHIARLTHRQFIAIRDLVVEAGVDPQVAAATAWLAADPQDAIAQLKRPRVEVIAAGVVAKIIEIDVMTAPLIRAPENLRMAAHRYEGEYRMPLYSSMEDNSALLLELNGTNDVDTAMRFYFSELAKIDNEIRTSNPYGDDIRDNGIRVGGILFPLVIEFAGRKPGVAGWETADSYGRTYFTQDVEGIEAAHVLEWLRQVPVDGNELLRHPLARRRAELLSIAGKVQAGSRVARSEVKRLRRAVMPKTKVILSVAGKIPLDEIRRRVVALQHLDRPTPFSTATDWQTRAEAVLSSLVKKGSLVGPDGVPAARVRLWLDHPIVAVKRENLHADDIAMIAVASMLPTTTDKKDRWIAEALKTRGVTGALRSNARSEIVAHVVCRVLQGGRDADGRRSAMERVLRWTELRDQHVDMRPVEAVLSDALSELDTANAQRALGHKPVVGPATRQLATRAAFHLICTPLDGNVLLPRSAPGAGSRSSAEPDRVLSKLVTTSTGIHQLAQSIFDGRHQFPIRRIRAGGQASSTTAPPRDNEVLSLAELQKLALDQAPVVADVSAATQIMSDSHELKLLLEQTVQTMRRMATRTDAVVPLVEERGWNDPFECMPLIDELAKYTGYWHQRHQMVNRPRPTDESSYAPDGS
ncbi:MAG: hypothetical protein M3443_00265 [Actinomycetota bacterium]|nr:hypothetical protein [Actinomycetota bacterium]